MFQLAVSQPLIDAGVVVGPFPWALNSPIARIDNRLHWVRDVTFDEDRSQVPH